MGLALSLAKVSGKTRRGDLTNSKVWISTSKSKLLINGRSQLAGILHQAPKVFGCARAQQRANHLHRVHQSLFGMSPIMVNGRILLEVLLRRSSLDTNAGITRPVLSVI